MVGVEGSGLVNGLTDIFDDGMMAVANNGETPKAYLQYVLLNESFEYVSSDAVPVSADDEWQHLVLEADVAEDGYLYAYLVNESNISVFFDDFTVQVLGTRAIRKTDYYPFGAVAKV